MKPHLKEVTDVRISEANIDGKALHVATICFKLVLASVSADQSQKAPPRITGELMDDEMGENSVAGSQGDTTGDKSVVAADDTVREEGEMNEVMDEVESAEQQSVPSMFPLAQLFENPNAFDGMEIRLNFFRLVQLVHVHI